MKIGIQTITDGTNFGNRLQNYALEKILKKHDVETFINNSYKNDSLKNFIKYYLKKIKTFIIIPELKKSLSFKKFNKEHINFSTIKTNNNIKKIDNFDKFICGSDQIWNANFKENGKANFLMFADKNKTIAYAASFGSNKIPKERIEEYKKYINHIKYISSREEAGIKLIEKLTRRKDSVLTLDPTLLLKEADWIKIMKKPKKEIPQKYILCYFLGKKEKKEILKFAKENNATIIDIMDKKSSYYTIGPSEFLYLEKNAWLICTDSFHSCVFALIFNRPFIVFERADKYASMSSRIDTFLSKFELENQKYKNNLNLENINCDYKKANKILKEERKKSINFLISSLK